MDDSLRHLLYLDEVSSPSGCALKANLRAALSTQLAARIDRRNVVELPLRIAADADQRISATEPRVVAMKRGQGAGR